MFKFRIIRKTYGSMNNYFVQYLDSDNVWQTLKYIEHFNTYEKAVEFVERTLLLQQKEVVMRVFD